MSDATNQSDAPYGPRGRDAAALAQFQETMRRFLRVQQSVMEAYRAGEPLPASGASSSPPSTDPAPNAAMFGDHSGALLASNSAPVAAEPPHAVASPPSQPPPEPNAGIAAEPSAVDLEPQLKQIVGERTGYPEDMLELDANLEADLGIDSIKRVEIIAAFRRAVLPALAEPPAWFMERMTGANTLRTILDGMRELQEQHTGAADAGGQQNARIEPAIAAAPVANADGSSIPLREACPRCVGRVVETPLPDEVVDGLSVTGTGVVLLTDDGGGVATQVEQAVQQRGGACVRLRTEDLVDRAAAEKTLARIRKQHGPIRAALHLLPLREAPAFPEVSPEAWPEFETAEVRGFYHLLQALAPELDAAARQPIAVIAVTRGGGDFAGDPAIEAAHPWRGGFSGLLKTAAREWETARFRAIDVDQPPAADTLLRELASEGPVEIGYRQGRRLTMLPMRAELPEAAPADTAELLGESPVVLVTGGARGITAEVVEEIAAHVPATFILIGRSPLPDVEEAPATAVASDPMQLRQAVLADLRASGAKVSPREVEQRVNALLAAREIRRTLATIQATGSHVEYYACDARNADAFVALIKQIQAKHGPITGVIHGAGVIEDKYIVDKQPASFARVVGTKIDPILTLVDVLDANALRLMMIFSSVAGFYGNPGQSDYTCANEMLNRIARRLRNVRPQTKVVAMCWGPWSGAGMVTPEVARQFEQRGVSMVTVPGGRRAAWLEIANGCKDDVRVLIGPGPWVEPANELAKQMSSTVA